MTDLRAEIESLERDIKWLEKNGPTAHGICIYACIDGRFDSHSIDQYYDIEPTPEPDLCSAMAAKLREKLDEARAELVRNTKGGET